MTHENPPADLALLDARMEEIAREIAALKRDDPRRADLVEEISKLTVMSAELKNRMI